MKFNPTTITSILLLFISLFVSSILGFQFKSPIFEKYSRNHQRSFINKEQSSARLLSRQARKKVRLQDSLLTNVEGFSQAFVGGTIGVMSVAVIVEIRRLINKGLDDCPYCLGNGEMLCAACCGSATVGNKSCELCGGRGMVMCLNCKGDGRITPIILQSRAVRDPVRYIRF